MRKGALTRRLIERDKAYICRVDNSKVTQDRESNGARDQKRRVTMSRTDHHILQECLHYERRADLPSPP